MLCKNCGCYADDDAIVCPECGRLLQFSPLSAEGGAEAIRQGRRAREAILTAPEKPAQKEMRRRRRSDLERADDSMPSVEDTRAADYPFEEADEGYEERTTGIKDNGNETFERRGRPVYSDNASRAEIAAQYAAASRPPGPPPKMINWVKVGIAALIIVIVAAAGGWFFLNRTETGQKLMARLGQNASSTAFWKIGEEKMDSGDIRGAIEDFETARALDAENDVVDVDGLLLLGNAYEADGMIDEAAALYEEIYTETPSRTEAYVNHIRILMASTKEGDRAKAGELMELAYEKTGDQTFYNQRSDLLPAPPQVDVIAGYYEVKKYLTITSFQGYDVYYTFDEEAPLPEGGTLFEERIFLDEGIHALRAVAVNGELVSDELRGTYKIIMPSPQTPLSSLAPATYKQRQRVRLRPGPDNENDTDIVIYYTIDGSNPDADSPKYEGEPFWLPGGRVTLKAVAVNKYNKVSNMLERLYKIEAKPYPLSAYTVEDGPTDFRLYVTSMPEFQQVYSTGTLTDENYVMEGLDTECRKYEYEWGYAVMSKTKKGWVLAQVYCTNSELFNLPRKTKVGDTADEVVGKFRDMGQVESPSGNRGLYSTKDGTGKIWLQEDGGKIIRYQTFTDDSHRWQLDYIVNDKGIVTAVDMRYLP